MIISPGCALFIAVCKLPPAFTVKVVAYDGVANQKIVRRLKNVIRFILALLGRSSEDEVQALMPRSLL
jgi:hypothetical protein